MRSIRDGFGDVFGVVFGTGKPLESFLLDMTELQVHCHGGHAAPLWNYDATSCNLKMRPQVYARPSRITVKESGMGKSTHISRTCYGLPQEDAISTFLKAYKHFMRRALDVTCFFPPRIVTSCAALDVVWLADDHLLHFA